MFSWTNHFSKEELDLIFLKTLTRPLGLTREPWNFSRGAKTVRHYSKEKHDGSDKFNAIDVRYTYTYPNGDLRKITSYSEKITFRNEDGTIYHELDVPISLNGKNIKEINRAIRFGRIDFLEDSAENMRDAADALPPAVDQPTLDYLVGNKLIPPMELADYGDFRNGLYYLADSIDFIFDHYESPIFQYKDRGTLAFEQAVANESDTEALKRLALSLPPTPEFPTGFTVRQALDYQLTGSLL